MTNSRENNRRDQGSILPMVLVMTVVLSAVVVSLASYVSAGLRYSHVVEDRADRLAAADGGLRYGIERLSLQSYAGCFTALGNTGYEIPFPTEVNQSEVTVTCRKVGTGFGDVQGWALIVTGQDVPLNEPLVMSQGGNTSDEEQKLLGGPVYVARVQDAANNFDLRAKVRIEDGDLWFSDTTAKCDTAEENDLTVPTNLSFKPILRGMLCLDRLWNELYTAPTPNVPTTPAPEPISDEFGCTVWTPGKYTATMPPLGSANYFRSGEYYFENVDLVIDQTVVAGWADFASLGDQQFIQNLECASAVYADKNTVGSTPGATFYLGGTSSIHVSKGELEILRRKQGDSVVSIQALDTTADGYIASSLGWNDVLLSSKSGSPDQDMVIHGLAWAPRAQLTFGNVTGAANGQLLGGAAFARVDLQASASASNFLIRIEPSERPVSVILDAEATKNGQSTTMRAIVQISDDGTESAVNSWRVCETADCSVTAPPPPIVSEPTPGAPCNVSAGAWTRDFGTGGWTAEFWNRTSTMSTPPSDPFSGAPNVTQNVSRVDKPDDTVIPASGVNATYYTARFTKSFEVTAACEIDLQRGSDDGVRVKVNGTTVIDDWNEYAYRTSNVSNVPLVAGTNTIVFEFYQRAGSSGYSLQWRD